MRTSFLCLLVLAGLTTGLRAQIPNTWTQEKLKKVYDVPATIAYTNADIKSIALANRNVFLRALRCKKTPPPVAR